MSRASRDTIPGWTKSGARWLLLEFQRPSVCREETPRKPCRGWDMGGKRSGVPRVNPLSIDPRGRRTRPVGEADDGAATR